MKIGSVLVALALLVAPAKAYTVEKTTVRTTVEVPVWIVLPDKADDKVPAVMLLHGTTGIIKAREWVYAERFAKMGIASIIIDTFTPRGIKDTLKDQGVVSAAQMSDDALRVLQTVANHPKLKGDKIALMGFSKGGAAALRTSYAVFNKPNKAQFALIIGMYPSCTDYRLDPTTTGKPLRLISGGRDKWVSPDTCTDIARILKEKGADVEAEIIPDAEHGWDVPGPAHKETPQAENYSSCRFLELPKRIWVESKSKMMVADERGVHKDRDKAMRNCMTYGVSSGYSENAAGKSWEMIKNHLRIIQN